MLEGTLVSGKIDALAFGPLESLFTSVPTALAQGTIEKLINRTADSERGCTAAEPSVLQFWKATQVPEFASVYSP